MVLSYASKNDNNVDQCIEFWQFLVLDHGRHVGETLDDDGNCTLRRNPSGKLSFDDLETSREEEGGDRYIGSQV